MKQFILTKEPVLGSEGVMYVPWGNVTFFYGGDGAERSYFSYRRKEDVKSAERGGRVGGKRNTIRHAEVT